MEVTWSNIIGKTILVGITYTDSIGNITDRKQFYGKVVNANNQKGISVLVDGIKGTYCLPPDLSSIKAASLGEYRLHSTGEIVVNPDLLSTWYIKKSE